MAETTCPTCGLTMSVFHPVHPPQDANTVAVDPGDLYTIVRYFYESDEPRSQAEQQCADRLNTALCGVGWEARDPRG